MHRNRHSIRGIIRHFKKIIAGAVYSGVVTGDQQMTLGIVAAWASYSIDKRLINLIAKFIRFCFSRAVAPRIPDAFPTKFFILWFKYQIIVIILKAVCYLLPHMSEAFHTFLFIVRKFVDPTAVPMNIDNCIHTAFKRPVDHLMNTRVIFGIDCVCTVMFHHIRPCHRNAKNTETFLCNSLDHFLCNNRTSPSGFIILRFSFAPFSDPVLFIPIRTGFKCVA